MRVNITSGCLWPEPRHVANRPKTVLREASGNRTFICSSRPVAVLKLRENRSLRGPVSHRKEDCRAIVAEEAMRFQPLYAMASISILVPTMFFACNVEREGLLPGKNPFVSM